MLETGHEICLRWDDHKVWRDPVSGHAVLALLHGTVETEIVLLGDAVEHDLVGHRRLDRATRAEALGEVIPEVVLQHEGAVSGGVEVCVCTVLARAELTFPHVR